MTDNPPDGVDPGLWSEFQRISDAVHRLDRSSQPHGEGGPSPWKLVIELPEQWVLLAAWMEARRHHRGHGKDGATGIEPAHIEYQRLMRGLAKRHVAWALHEYFHQELHEHCNGQGWLLRPERERSKTDVDAGRNHGHLDDDIPF